MRKREESVITVIYVEGSAPTDRNLMIGRIRYSEPQKKQNFASAIMWLAASSASVLAFLLLSWLFCFRFCSSLMHLTLQHLQAMDMCL